ncbi:MAG: pentapeptide repeat-containing protein [Albidovulum sp.]|nr:pentapeptide repeat-containing protein [Albidovulum sp.]
MDENFAEFWKGFLESPELGEDEESRRLNWNRFLWDKFRQDVQSFVEPEGMEEVERRLGVLGQPEPSVKSLWDALIKKHGEIPHPDSGWPFPITSYMDFSGTKLNLQTVSFAGRLLIGADFRHVKFVEATSFETGRCFEKCEFVGIADFTGSEFVQPKKNYVTTVSFQSSTFRHEAKFDEVRFPRSTNFADVRFCDRASFKSADFGASSSEKVVFERSRFEGNTIFTEAKIRPDVRFEDAKFDGYAIFRSAVFGRNVSFNNAKFGSSTSFRNAKFNRPPKFFETELHEDVDLNDTDWSSAERSYKLSTPRKSLQKAGKIALVDDAIRAWDRLAMMMQQQEKPRERHEFFRLKMRALRQRDGSAVLSAANRIFEASSDYGWGFGRALLCWAGQIILMGFALAHSDVNCWRVVWNGLVLSFANSHAILGLSSKDGHLHFARTALTTADTEKWVLDAVGAVQSVLGPILLFLVLLTLRNRFRLP